MSLQVDQSSPDLPGFSRKLGLEWRQLQDLPLQVDLPCPIEDSQIFVDRIQGVVPLRGFASRLPSGALQSTSAALVCGHITLSSTVHSSLEIELEEHPYTTLAIPYAGNSSVRIAGQELIMQPRLNAVYMPGEAYAGRTQSYAGVMITMPQQGLVRTAQAIAGWDADSGRCRLTLQRPMVLAASGGQSHELLFSLRRLLSVYNGSALIKASTLVGLALEDAIQRLTILLVCPELLAESEVDRLVARDANGGRNPIFDTLIDWILADLTRPITISQLENFSGYSRRSLQYMFRSRYGMGPMQWLREQRLRAVWSRLKEPAPGETVTAIATRYGFISASSFARLFQRTFGQLPSELLRESQRRQS